MAPATRRASPPPASEPPPEPGRSRTRSLVLPLAILAVILAGAAVAIALVATADNGKNKGGPSPSTSASTSPSASASATPSSPATTAPASLTPGNASLDSAEAVVMAVGYTPYQDAAEFWDPQAPINVVLGTLTGSADGYNNWAFFFAGNRLHRPRRHDPEHADRDPSRTTTVITLAYQLYGPSDPTCCPTGGTQTVRYQWNGSQARPARSDPERRSDRQPPLRRLV